MENSNRKNGTDFEKRLCEYFYAEGYWVHNFAQKTSGQPCDIIAVNQDDTMLIDCKQVHGTSFPLSRVEDNQFRAMCSFTARTGKKTLFAFEIEDEVYLLPFSYIAAALANGKKSISVNLIKEIGICIS